MSRETEGANQGERSTYTKRAVRVWLVAVMFLGTFASGASADDEKLETAIEIARSIIGEVNGKTKRSCKGEYVVEYNGEQVTFGSLEARRGCGRFVLNRCRRRARNQLEQCMRQHWSAADEAPRPDGYCATANGETGIVRYNVDVLEQTIQDIARTLRSAPEAGQPFTVTVSSRIYGDTGCGSGNDKSRTALLGRVQVTAE